MRAHGVGNWPDPSSNGGFLVQGSGSANPLNAPDYSSANKTCEHLLPNNGGPTSVENQKIEAAALKYSQCMRVHGILNFPDPAPGGGVNLGGTESIDGNTPQFQSALKICRPLVSSFLGGKTKSK
jgi:hypothetical protein